MSHAIDKREQTSHASANKVKIGKNVKISPIIIFAKFGPGAFVKRVK